MKRYGMVIRIRNDRIAEYRDLHANGHPGVRDLLTKANMHNFSIFIAKFPDGNHVLFGYYEYTGSDYGADMRSLAGHQRNIDWLSMTAPMQIPFPGGESWTMMDQVYFHE